MVTGLVKILLINYEYPPVGGGAGNATRELARALVTLGHEPVVLTAAFRNRLTSHADAGVRLIQIPSRRAKAERASTFEMASFVWGALRRIRRILREERVDGIWCFFSIPCGPVAWWGWRATKIPYLVLLRGGDVPGNEPSLNWMHALLKPLRHAVLRNARAVVANSHGLKAAAERADPFAVSVVPNGVDTTFWRPNEYTQKRVPRRYLFVGRFQPQKNLAWLLHFLANRMASGESFELHLVGDGPQRRELGALAETLGLSTRIVWHGWLDKEALRDRYQTCDILINPSLYEGMPNVVLEAAACGLECWLSDIPEHRELGGITGAEAGSLLRIDKVLLSTWRDSAGTLVNFFAGVRH